MNYYSPRYPPPTTKDKTKMKSTELRIGNWINLTKDDFKTVKPYQLEGIDIYKLDESNCADIAPIELTEDWLKRFGFHKWGCDDIPSTVSFELGILNLQYSKNVKCYGWIFEKREPNNSLSWYPKVEIKYVHQLQNLYRCLCGKELEIK